MALYVGTTAIQNVYLGSTQAKAVYLGAAKVWSAFNPAIFENVTVVDEPTPEGTAGAWFEALGAGGGGGGGYRVKSANSCGAAGGGGGGKIPRIWIPISSFGPTFSLTRGLSGVSGAANGTTPNPGGDGGDSILVTGSITLTAGGGKGGAPGGGQFTNSSAGGAGGVCTAVGLSGVTLLPGAQGGNGRLGSLGGGTNGDPGDSTSSGAGAGGGAGGGTIASGSGRQGGI